MSEYIVGNDGDESILDIGEFELRFQERERIVRCRDCDSWSGPCEIRPGSVDGVCDGWSATGNVVLTREDDFCSYGARREEER